MRKIWNVVSSRRGRSVVAVMVVGLLGVGAVNMDHRTPNQRAQAWTAAHANALPATLEEFASFPDEYQSAIFMAMPAAEKSRLWQTQLQSILDTEPNLTADQRAFVVRTMAMATPASFSGVVPAPEVCTDIVRLFTNPAVKQRFRMLGAGVTPVRSVQSALVLAKERIRATVLLNADPIPCTCRGYGLCECGGDKCIDGVCEPSNLCGCVWAGPCDKTCVPLSSQMRVGK